MSDHSAEVVVIGAGHNSLIGAAYLAAAGLDVVVLEEQTQVGGNTITEELTLPGFRHDSCSSAHVLIQSNPLVKDDELGLAALGLRYVHTDPTVVLPLPDGDATVMSRDRETTAAELGRWSEEDGAAYLRILADWEGGLAASHSAWNAARLDPATSAADAEYAALRRRSATDVIAEGFTHQRSRDLLTWLSFATITDPRSPGTGILPFSITAGRAQFGWATPIGGSGTLPDALPRRRLGSGARPLRRAAGRSHRGAGARAERLARAGRAWRGATRPRGAQSP
jgi:phytoene dehydrogenase-like protein